MKKLTFLFLLAALPAALLAQEPLDESRPFIEVQIIAPAFGNHYKAVYRSEEYRYDYVKDESGKHYKFSTVAAVFTFFQRKGYEPYSLLIVEAAIQMPNMINAHIFRRKVE